MAMQKQATNVFIGASVVFGILGVLFWATTPLDDSQNSDLSDILSRLLGITASVILASFALSVAGKYLGNGD